MSAEVYSKKVKDTSILRLGLFGGTFDPPHNGHGLIAQAALERFALSRIIFIPCRQSPHKGESKPASSVHRLEMLKKMIRKVPRMEISTYELRKKTPSYTYLTIRHFETLYPGADLFWIMGSDQWEVFHKWTKYDEIADKVKFIIFPRPTVSPPRKSIPHHRLEMRVDVSSTSIRNRIKNNESVRFMLPESVEQYIRLKRLYLK